MVGLNLTEATILIDKVVEEINKVLLVHTKQVDNTSLSNKRIYISYCAAVYFLFRRYEYVVTKLANNYNVTTFIVAPSNELDTGLHLLRPHQMKLQWV